MASVPPRASKMRLSTPRSASAVKNLILSSVSIASASPVSCTTSPSTRFADFASCRSALLHQLRSFLAAVDPALSLAVGLLCPAVVCSFTSCRSALLVHVRPLKLELHPLPVRSIRTRSSRPSLPSSDARPRCGNRRPLPLSAPSVRLRVVGRSLWLRRRPFWFPASTPPRVESFGCWLDTPQSLRVRGLSCSGRRVLVVSHHFSTVSGVCLIDPSA